MKQNVRAVVLDIANKLTYFILGCVDHVPLGMSNGHISNAQITQSSRKSPRTEGYLARLNATKVQRSGGWTAHPQDTNSWFQIDFLMRTVVNTVATQGRLENSYWVESYSLSYSDNGVLFTNYGEGGEHEVIAEGLKEDSFYYFYILII